MEESISRESGSDFGENLPQEEVRRLIPAVRRTPVVCPDFGGGRIRGDSLPLNERRGVSAVRTHDQVPLPVPRDCTVLDFGGSLADRDGIDGSTAMRVEYRPGAVSAGRFSIGLGGLPAYYLPNGVGESWQHVISPQSTFREIYWRQYLRLEAGWSGVPRKFSRVRVLSGPQPGDGTHRLRFRVIFGSSPTRTKGARSAV